ncbi:hypothetical protein ACH5RR_032496 [Cinchona calisaya]|uniref:Uncharacterized protein n=1 Tax=Cinchona calisaya TaxID=153742 RepID=A0ABD2YME0_9GENT
MAVFQLTQEWDGVCRQVHESLLIVVQPYGGESVQPKSFSMTHFRPTEGWMSSWENHLITKCSGSRYLGTRVGKRAVQSLRPVSAENRIMFAKENSLQLDFQLIPKSKRLAYQRLARSLPEKARHCSVRLSPIAKNSPLPLRGWSDRKRRSRQQVLPAPINTEELCQEEEISSRLQAIPGFELGERLWLSQSKEDAIMNRSRSKDLAVDGQSWKVDSKRRMAITARSPCGCSAAPSPSAYLTLPKQIF